LYEAPVSLIVILSIARRGSERALELIIRVIFLKPHDARARPRVHVSTSITGNFVAGKPEGNGNFVAGKPEGNGNFVAGKPEGNGNFVAGKPKDPAK
jgi:hypothetical protein